MASKWPIKNLRGWSAQRGATGPSFIIKGVVFIPDSKGSYYIAVGSEGEDRTGTYTISIAGKRIE